MAYSGSGWKIVRNKKTEVGLDAWRRLNHEYDTRDPLRHVQLLEKLLASSQVCYGDVERMYVGQTRHPWMWTSLPSPREGRRAEKGRTRSLKPRSFTVTVSGAVHTAMR